MIKVEKKTASITTIDVNAVKKYEDYFDTLMNNYTFRLNLLNDQSYFVFSSIDKEEWQKVVFEDRTFISATRYLDNIQMEDINILTIKSIVDVTTEVKESYLAQRNVIFNSLRIVVELLKHQEMKVVKDSIKIVEKSRENTESKRKYWRALNESYYGLDIHPLMEFEEEELQKMLYICQNPDTQIHSSFTPNLLGTSSAIASGMVVGYILIKVIAK